MEVSRIILKPKIQEFVSKLLKEYELYAPVKENDLINFSAINTNSEIAYDYYNSTKPPKQILFTQSETLFKFKLGRKSAEIEMPENSKKEKIILGIRPCDAKSFSLLDKVFDNEYKDNYYLTKRRSTILIGLSCPNPKATCFCTSLGSTPFSKENLDLLLTDIGESYYVEIVTERGAKTIKVADELFSKPTKKEEEKRAEAQVEAEKKIVRHLSINKIPDQLEDIYDATIWESIGEKCIGCGICAYLCPTCHCFDINDELSASRTKGARIRTWDYCTHQIYTLQTSGFNPRPTQKYRVRNRIYHKFKYLHDNFNILGCVGCGRCIEHCPVNIDVTEILSKINSVSVEK
ncbi:MAG: 4Fe-4S dicluster domain-containing protein [Candidatus Thermoplasmatota archaeon]|nr:4Fe-4S dicluster domain-containing protein [Candidatus Thermoplasmatota archaeon]